MRAKVFKSITLFLISCFLISPLLAQIVVDLSSSTISGEVEIGSTAETRLSYVYVNANGGSTLGSSYANIYPSPIVNAVPYQMTVNVPVGASANYNVYTNAYMDQNHDLIVFRSVSTSVGDGAPATGVDLTLANPGFIEGLVSVTGATLNYAYIYFYAPASSGVSYSRSRVYSNATTSSPASGYRVALPTGVNLTLGGQVHLTNGASISIPSQTISVAAGTDETANINLTYIAPATGSIDGSITFAGDLSVHRYYIQSSGRTGRTDYLNGPHDPLVDNLATYELGSLTPYSSYRVYANAEFLDSDTTSRKYLRFPYSSFDPAYYPINVVAGETETVDVSDSQALIRGHVNFSGSASLADASTLYLYANGYGAQSGGSSRDYVAPSGTGDFELVVTPGSWRQYYLYTRIYNYGAGVAADYRDIRINYYDDNATSNPLLTSSTSIAVQDHDLSFGEVTINVQATGSVLISNPRISSSYCEYRDMNNIRQYYYYLTAYSNFQNNLTEASVTAIAPEGSCTLRIYGYAGGSNSSPKDSLGELSELRELSPLLSSLSDLFSLNSLFSL